jgi:uncharacterized membrane protein YjgN (DUF898 family)
LDTESTGTLPAAQTEYPFSFTGDGWEYFRIWIVNLGLSIATVGIYSAWAKVRRMQYFYRHTSVAGSSFNYHGRPATILKGRIVALLLLGGYQLAFKISYIAGGITVIALAAVFPWLLWRSLRFRLFNSSYRGLRFAFGGRAGTAYIAFLWLPILAVATGYLLAPVAHHLIKSWQHDNSAYGRSRFSFDPCIGAFYRIYLKAAGLGVLVLVAGGIGLVAFAGGLATAGGKFAPVMILLPLGMYLLGLLVVAPYFQARIANLVWERTGLADHRFRSRLSARRLAFIGATNLLGVVCTLGLYRPFAQIRMARYRVECMHLMAAGDLEAFVAGESQSDGAVGEEAADFFDIDIAL